MQANARLHVSRNSRFILNVAEGDTSMSSGGAILALGNANIILEGSEFIYNRAVDADGGGIALLQDSRLESTDVRMVNNTAHRRGGALFVGAETVLSGTIPVILREHNTFERNAAFTLDGGAIFSHRNIEFLAGGVSRLHQNYAGQSGGAVTLLNCDLIVRIGHGIEASYNEVCLHLPVFDLSCTLSIL